MFIPTVNIWCAQTRNPIILIAAIAWIMFVLLKVSFFPLS